jgi:hypothetical protein
MKLLKDGVVLYSMEFFAEATCTITLERMHINQIDYIAILLRKYDEIFKDMLFIESKSMVKAQEILNKINTMWVKYVTISSASFYFKCQAEEDLKSLKNKFLFININQSNLTGFSQKFIEKPMVTSMVHHLLMI